MNRSPIAERVFKKEMKRRGIKNIQADSYGLQGFILPPTKGRSLKDYPKEYKLSLPHIKKLKISMEDHVSKPLTKEIINNANIIITMANDIHKELLNKFPEVKNKTFLISNLSKAKVNLNDVEGSRDPIFYKETIENTEKLILEIFNKIIKKIGEELESQ